ncbi:MAG: hypothetical protein AAFU78_10275 [Cyanobacteria bacterium J06633_2]
MAFILLNFSISATVLNQYSYLYVGRSLSNGFIQTVKNGHKIIRMTDRDPQ